MQTKDPLESTNLTRTDLSRSGLHLWRVGDGSQTVRTNSDGSSGGFRPQKPEPPELPDKNSKNDENHVDPATFGRPSFRSALIRPRSCIFLTQICLILANPTQIYSSLTPTRLNLGQIFIDLKESHLTLLRSDQIWQDPTMFQPKTSELENPKPIDSHPKTDMTRPAWSETLGESVAGQNLPHPIMSGRVRVGHKPNPAWPVDTPYS